MNEVKLQFSDEQFKSVCADCVYVQKAQPITQYGVVVSLQEKSWTCKAVPPKILRPAGVNTITGESYEEDTLSVRCTIRNAHGECLDFATHPRPIVSADEKPKIEAKLFESAWSAALDKLTASERDMVETVVNGAQVNYTALYMLIACVFGVAIGVAAMGLWG